MTSGMFLLALWHLVRGGRDCGRGNKLALDRSNGNSRVRALLLDGRVLIAGGDSTTRETAELCQP